MKTKDRILLATRLLFNEEGERNIAIVDIAAATDLSPGNLYYHYRGKEELVLALFDEFETRLNGVLDQPIEELDSFQQHWAFLYEQLSVSNQYQCLYGDLSDVVRRNTKINRRFAKLLARQQLYAQQMCHQLCHYQLFDMTQTQIDTTANLMGILLGNWINHTLLLRPNKTTDLQQGVLETMSLFTPYAREPEDFMRQCLRLFSSPIDAE